MKKLLSIFIVVVLVIYALVLFNISQVRKLDTKTTKPSVSILTKRPSLPVKIIIPSININTDIESVGMDKTGAMDEPKNTANVAWYNLGPRPGEIGSAVMAGHLDTKTGAPAVFWNISKLKIGDNITVVGKNGERIKYYVSDVKIYDLNTFPLEYVFARHNKKKT